MTFTPDPFTEEGMAEIKRRLERRKNDAAAAAARSLVEPDSEPSGFLTQPSEFDRYRDKKHAY